MEVIFNRYFPLNHWKVSVLERCPSWKVLLYLQIKHSTDTQRVPTIPVSVHKYLNTIINNGTTTKLISNLNITNYKCNKSQLVEKANKIREGPKHSTLRQNNVVRSTFQMMLLRKKFKENPLNKMYDFHLANIFLHSLNWIMKSKSLLNTSGRSLSFAAIIVTSFMNPTNSQIMILFSKTTIHLEVFRPMSNQSSLPVII